MRMLSWSSQQKRHLYVALSILLVFVLLMDTSACGKNTAIIKAENLMKDISPNSTEGKKTDTKFISSTADFSINLFKKTVTNNKNSLISPVSVLLALSMTANGADKATLAQMEKVIGNGIEMDSLNKYLYSYVKNLPSEKKSKLNIANSIWFRDNEERLSVEKDFLQKNADFYSAQIYKSAFDDQTVKDINNWVKNNTDGMIDEIIEDIDDNVIMYLINALVFDAEWETVYSKSDIVKDTFTDINGTEQDAELMISKEDRYLSDNNMTGFIKPYYGNKYSFVAILPNEGIPVDVYLSGMSGTSFMSLINNAKSIAVNAMLPKFSYDYKIVMNDALSVLGMKDAFLPGVADFSKLGRSSAGNIYIGEVLHKTYISVDELGTKAGAVTKVEMNETAMKEMKTVKLDRPFIYAIIDNSTNLPVFIGTVMTLDD